jgi:hypothetical protein
MYICTCGAMNIIIPSDMSFTGSLANVDVGCLAPCLPAGQAGGVQQEGGIYLEPLLRESAGVQEGIASQRRLKQHT